MRASDAVPISEARARLTELAEEVVGAGAEKILYQPQAVRPDPERPRHPPESHSRQQPLEFQTECITTLGSTGFCIIEPLNSTGEGPMANTLTVAEIKRRGMAAIEEGLRRGPVHIIKRNKPAAVVLSEEEYRRLVHGKAGTPQGMSVVQWLLAQPVTGTRSKDEIDAELKAERAW
jgi:PHD/YefM family antitoxin component YafN of YafNO toxin-antitoxin module